VLINQQKNQLSDSLKRHQELNKLLNQQNEEIQSSKREIEEVNRQLSESNVTKDRFISIIGHDLRNPFHSMMGFSHLLDHEYDDFTTEEKKKFIGIINQGLHNTYNLLDNLLKWAASQRGTLSFEPQKINIFQLADSACKLLKPAANDKSITVFNAIPDTLYAYGDANMISTIFGNLISNAVKFTPKEGEVRIEADTKPANGYIIISVKDNGLGMSEEVVSSLFDFGENFSTPGTQNEAGTGLGLVLCKEFVEKHNGKIWVESIEEKGSAFYFTIPSTTED
jgi:signal transduction histidine kinase